MLKIYILVFLAVAASAQGSGCLTPAQKGNLTEAVTIIDHTLDVVEVGLLIAAELENNATIKNQLLEARHIIKIIQVDIVNNLTRIADETCGTCREITEAVGDIIKDLEDALTQIEPDWRNNPLYEAIVAAISSIIGLVESICPSSIKMIADRTLTGHSLITEPKHEKCSPEMRCKVCMKKLGHLQKAASICSDEELHTVHNAMMQRFHLCKRTCEDAKMKIHF